MMEYFDSYFASSSEALTIALQNNKILAPNKQVKSRQICYYAGDKIVDAPSNCIHVPFESFVDFFSNTKNRLPVKFYIEESIDKQLTTVKQNIENRIKELKSKIQKQEPIFTDKKLRIFAFGCRETVLIQHIVKSIIEAANTLGYETLLHTQTNDLESCSERFYLESLYSFNPHITININHLNNDFLNKYIYNFIWFQDYMPILTDDRKIVLRDRDTVLFLTNEIKYFLEKKGISSSYQAFCINNKLFKKRNSIEREEKIVFIGSSYKHDFDKINNKLKYKASEEIFNIYIKSGYISRKRFKYFQSYYDLSYYDLSYLCAYVERDLLLKYILNMDLKIKIELYGRNWDYENVFKEHYKCVLEYGEEVSRIYNSAKYTLVLGEYVLQQRTLEAAASGTIPLVLDVRIDEENCIGKCYEESLEFFKIPDELTSILKMNNKKDLDCIVNSNSYESFIESNINKVLIKNCI